RYKLFKRNSLPGLSEFVNKYILPKPTLWAEPGSMNIWGMLVSIWCEGNLEAPEYNLFKEKSSALWDKQKTPESTHKAKFSIMYMTDLNAGRYHCNYHTGSSTSHNGTSQADLPLGPVTHRGIYRCYGSFNGTPYAWLSPSDPRHLSQESEFQDYTVENLILVCMAGLVLVVLGILLFETQHSQRRTQGARRK
uniref:Leukocyte immunoglobulin-like receptor subfamily A member 5 n=1 Tax=Castor canadensis TaxID=51338 RepID=A0A8C0WNS0_CASCN